MLFLFLFSAPCFAGDFPNALSLQGYTGLLNTPNAETTDDGKLAGLYSNQKEPQWRDSVSREENYLFSVGLLPFAEFGGRITDASGTAVRDLSVNFKFKVPGTPQGPFIPALAIGVQDAGGGSKHLQTNYIVATETWQRVRLSIGAGTGPDRMKGVFGGAEIKVADWFSLIGENDTKATNVGARIASQDLFGFPVRVQAILKTTVDERPANSAIAVGLLLPLGTERLNRLPVPEKAGVEAAESEEQRTVAERELKTAPAGSVVRSIGPETTAIALAPGSAYSDLVFLAKKLAADGFQNVRVGTGAGGLLVVEYENERYNYNELDGMGVVVGMVADTVPGGYETLRLVLRKQDIAVLQVSAPLEDFRAFLHDAGAEERLREHLLISADADEEGVDFAGERNPSWISSSLVVYPGLKTFVATDVGVFDYLLSAKLDYFVNAWKGAVVNARWDVPITWSGNFDDGKAFRTSRQDSQLDRLMLFQAFRIAPGVMANLGGGMVLHDSYGTLNELMWTPGDGTHRFTFRQARTESSDDQVLPRVRESYLGSYRYYFSPLNLFFEGTAGRFFDNDRGFRVEMKRFFGDTAFSVYYVNSETTSHERVQIGGVMIALPLTLRRDMKPGVVQLRGSNDWSYAQETRIVSTGEINTVSESVGVDPKPPFNLGHVFYNRDRLSDPYIRAHLLRLRDAYITFRNVEKSGEDKNVPERPKILIPAPLNPTAE